MESLKLKLVGAAPLLQHNSRLSDPLDPIAKELKSAAKATTKGTDAGIERTARLEFAGSLYLTDEGELYIPGVAIERALRDGSAGVQKGLKKRFDAAVFVNDDALLKIGGKQGTTPDELYDAGHVLRVSAKVQMSRVMRTRPCFKEWSAIVVVQYQPALVDRDTVLRAAEYAGQVVGLGDWRPRFGRFDVEVVK